MSDDACKVCGWSRGYHGTWCPQRDVEIDRYCQPCGEFLLPKDKECPFCGQLTVPVDDLPNGVGCPDCGGDCHCAPDAINCPFREPEPCPHCKGWGVGNVNDYSIDPCPICGIGKAAA